MLCCIFLKAEIIQFDVSLVVFRGHKDKIFVAKWNPFDNNKLVTVGVKHIKFWSQAGDYALCSLSVQSSDNLVDSFSPLL